MICLRNFFKKLFDRHFTLYFLYVKELNTNFGRATRARIEKHANHTYKEYRNNPYIKWIDLYSKANGNLKVGFLLIEHGPDCPEETDFYISEAFVLRKFRNRGIMTDAVGAFLATNNHPSISLHVIRWNTPAQKFWRHAFNSLGYVEKPLMRDNLSREDLDLYGYEKLHEHSRTP